MPTVFDHHPEDDALEQYSLGSLSDSQLEQVEEHLLICAACQDRLAEIDAFTAAAREAARELRHEQGRAGARWLGGLSPKLAGLNPAWAAVLAGVALLLPWAAWMRNSGANATAPAAVVLLQSTRDRASAHAPAGAAVKLVMDITELPQLPTYRFMVVNSDGAPVIESRIKAGGRRISFELPELKAGNYWVRLYEPSTRELLREFGLRVQ